MFQIEYISLVGLAQKTNISEYHSMYANNRWSAFYYKFINCIKTSVKGLLVLLQLYLLEMLIFYPFLKLKLLKIMVRDGQGSYFSGNHAV